MLAQAHGGAASGGASAHVEEMAKAKSESKEE